MNTSIKLFLLIATFIVSTSFTSQKHKIGDWQKLGTKVVSYKLDRDVIRVGANDGRFTKLKVLVTGGNLNMHKMIVEYGNGTKDMIPLKHNFQKGSDTRIIDLEGKKRVIKDITFIYDTKNRSRKKAKVHVFGRR